MEAPYRAIFGFDMETDIGSFTREYQGVKKGTPKLLRLLEKKGISATFFFTGDAAARNKDIVKLVQNEGHEIGTHSLYHETVGDELFDGFGAMVLLPEEVPLRLQKCTEWVSDITGLKPKSFRSPRLWGSTLVVNTLEEMGYTIDSSYPMYFYRKRFLPYHPDKSNWLEEGSMSILEIPNFADMLMESKDPEFQRDRDPWQVYRVHGAKAHYKYIENFLKFMAPMEGIPVICFYLHPWEFFEMPREIVTPEGRILIEEFIVKNTGDKALQELGKLIDMIIDDGAQLLKAEELVGLY